MAVSDDCTGPPLALTSSCGSGVITAAGRSEPDVNCSFLLKLETGNKGKEKTQDSNTHTHTPVLCKGYAKARQVLADQHRDSFSYQMTRLACLIILTDNAG